MLSNTPTHTDTHSSGNVEKIAGIYKWFFKSLSFPFQLRNKFKPNRSNFLIHQIPCQLLYSHIIYIYLDFMQNICNVMVIDSIIHKKKPKTNGKKHSSVYHEQTME